MAGKTSDWRPGPTVCRCCLTEGCYKDISTEYFWMGKREVYAEMLNDTFNVSISYAQTGGRLICEPCIARLRDASDFKRQVQDCEKTFMNHLDPSTSKSSSIQVEVESLDDVKMERVKVEKDDSDDDDDFPEPDFGDDDDTDDLDDEPLTKLASAKIKVPKKEEVGILDMLDTSQITVKRKTSSKTKEPPKKIKKKEVVVKPTTSKAKAAAAAAEKKKKEQSMIEIEPSPITEAFPINKTNRDTLLKYTTAIPFAMKGIAMSCYYCLQTFDLPEKFREHVASDHSLTDPLLGVPNGLLKVDCTDFRCRICFETYASLEDMASHLMFKHELKLELRTSFSLVPFVLHGASWFCIICSLRRHSFKTLTSHVAKHLFTEILVCDECGKLFSHQVALAKHGKEKHKKESHREEHVCELCGKSFPRKPSLVRHVKNIHKKKEQAMMHMPPVPTFGTMFTQYIGQQVYQHPMGSDGSLQ